MDVKFFQLLRRFSRDSTQTGPPDQETVALSYMQRAYELGKDAGRAEAGQDRTDSNDPSQSDDPGNGSEGGRNL